MATLAGVALVGVTFAQPISVPRNTRPVEEKPAPAGPKLPAVTTAAPLSADLLRIDAVGLSMNVPDGSVILQASTADGTSAFNVTPQGAEANLWAMRVSPKRTKTDQTTVEQTAESISQQVYALAAGVDPKTGEMVASRVTVLHKDMAFRIAGCPTPGARMYFSVPNDKGPATIKGYTVFKPLAQQFVIFELSTSQTNFDKARAAYELSVATAKFTDPTAALQSRAAALVEGAQFTGLLTEQALIAALPPGTIAYRLYQPGASTVNDDERGYRFVTFTRGKRSDLGREVSMTTSGADPEGIVMNTRARILAPRGMVIDTETSAFSAFDRTSEAWVTKTAVREQGSGGARQPKVYSETGFRDNRSLSVLTREPGKPDRSSRHEIQGDQYLSQAEVQLLPMLLQSGEARGELGFYAYRSDTGTISLRRETVEPGKESVRITSSLRDGDEVLLTLVKDAGRFVRTELADGTVWEPIDGETLLKIWKSKGLPTGK